MWKANEFPGYINDSGKIKLLEVSDANNLLKSTHVGIMWYSFGSKLEFALEHVSNALRLEDSLRIGDHRSRKVLMPSVNNESLARDQTGGVTEEKDCGVGNVLNNAFASKWNEGLHRTLSSSDTEAAHAFSSGNGPRSDNVRSNPPRSLLNGDHMREGVNPGLGGGNVGLIREPFEVS